MNQPLRCYMASAIAEEVKREIDQCEEHCGPFHSLLEGLAALREEYNELEEAILWGVTESGDAKCVRSTAIQVAAVATRIAMMVSPVPVESITPWEEDV